MQILNQCILILNDLETKLYSHIIVCTRHMIKGNPGHVDCLNENILFPFKDETVLYIYCESFAMNVDLCTQLWHVRYHERNGKGATNVIEIVIVNQIEVLV